MTRIEQARYILHMIETYDTKNTEVLDEIDARWWLVAEGYINAPHNAFWHKDVNVNTRFICQGNLAPKYTRRRDALKAIRLDGWVVNLVLNFNDNESFFAVYNWFGDNVSKQIDSPKLPTEELAELHAIIQTYIYTWENE